MAGCPGSSGAPAPSRRPGCRPRAASRRRRRWRTPCAARTRRREDDPHAEQRAQQRATLVGAARGELADADRREAGVRHTAGERHERQHGHVLAAALDAEMAKQQRGRQHAREDADRVPPDTQDAASDGRRTRLARGDDVVRVRRGVVSADARMGAMLGRSARRAGARARRSAAGGPDRENRCDERRRRRDDRRHDEGPARRARSAAADGAGADGARRRARHRRRLVRRNRRDGPRSLPGRPHRPLRALPGAHRPAKPRCAPGRHAGDRLGRRRRPASLAGDGRAGARGLRRPPGRGGRAALCRHPARPAGPAGGARAPSDLGHRHVYRDGARDPSRRLPPGRRVPGRPRARGRGARAVPSAPGSRVRRAARALRRPAPPRVAEARDRAKRAADLAQQPAPGLVGRAVAVPRGARAEGGDHGHDHRPAHRSAEGGVQRDRRRAARRAAGPAWPPACQPPHVPRQPRPPQARAAAPRGDRGPAHAVGGGERQPSVR